MPADLPFSPENGIDGEFAKWLNEFAIRSEGFDDYDSMDLRVIADRFLDSDVEKQEFLDDASGFVEAMKSSGPRMHRLPVLHVTRENLGEVSQRAELPEGFMQDIAMVGADYINGFIPGQNITAPEVNSYEHDYDSDRAGSYSFRKDHSWVYPKGGDLDQGSSATTVLVHEAMHKNNAEALLDDPDAVRHYALIYNANAPEEFKQTVKSMDTAPVNHDILGGLALLFLDEFYDAGIVEGMSALMGSRTEMGDYLGEFQFGADLMEEAYNLDSFDSRDEAVAQAVSFFMDGAFEEGFDSCVESKREYYNDSTSYSEGAGDEVADHLSDMKSEFEDAEGLRGQRFKDVMGKRIPFLRGEERFSKY